MLSFVTAEISLVVVLLTNALLDDLDISWGEWILRQCMPLPCDRKRPLSIPLPTTIQEYQRSM